MITGRRPVAIRPATPLPSGTSSRSSGPRGSPLVVDDPQHPQLGVEQQDGRRLGVEQLAQPFEQLLEELVQREVHERGVRDRLEARDAAPRAGSASSPATRSSSCIRRWSASTSTPSEVPERLGQRRSGRISDSVSGPTRTGTARADRGRGRPVDAVHGDAQGPAHGLAMRTPSSDRDDLLHVDALVGRAAEEVDGVSVQIGDDAPAIDDDRGIGERLERLVADPVLAQGEEEVVGARVRAPAGAAHRIGPVLWLVVVGSARRLDASAGVVHAPGGVRARPGYAQGSASRNSRSPAVCAGVAG